MRLHSEDCRKRLEARIQEDEAEGHRRQHLEAAERRQTEYLSRRLEEQDRQRQDQLLPAPFTPPMPPLPQQPQPQQHQPEQPQQQQPEQPQQKRRWADLEADEQCRCVHGSSITGGGAALRWGQYGQIPGSIAGAAGRQQLYA